MEMEYKDPSRRGRWIVLLGVVLAIVAGAAAFFLINNAQQQAGSPVARPFRATSRPSRSLPARRSSARTSNSARTSRSMQPTRVRSSGPIAARGTAPRSGRCHGAAADRQPPRVRHRRPRLRDPPPDETVAPRLGGVACGLDHGARRPGGRRRLGAGMSVDVFVTATVRCRGGPSRSRAPGGLSEAPVADRWRDEPAAGYESGESTKVTYQGVKILSKTGTFYILKVPLIVAEEISHCRLTARRRSASPCGPTRTRASSTCRPRRHDKSHRRSATACRSPRSTRLLERTDPVEPSDPGPHPAAVAHRAAGPVVLPAAGRLILSEPPVSPGGQGQTSDAAVAGRQRSPSRRQPPRVADPARLPTARPGPPARPGGLLNSTAPDTRVQIAAGSRSGCDCWLAA